jgi:hypothetical protein
MIRKPLLLLLFLMVILACQVVPTPPALRATPRIRIATETPLPQLQSTNTIVAPTLAANEPAPATNSPGELAAIPYHSVQPFAQVNVPDWKPEEVEWSWPINLPAAFGTIQNPGVADGLTLRQRNTLTEDGFVILHSQEAQFNELHQRVSLFYGQPYLLTTDAAQHAWKITFDELIQALEREELHRRLISVVQATYDQVMAYFPIVTGSDLEPETRLAAAYLGVGLRLLDPDKVVDPELGALVDRQVDQIMAARGVEASVLLPDFQDDFSRYRPIGHYETDPQLASYFRGLNWLGGVYFLAADSGPGAATYHVPLIVTLALRQARTDSGPCADEWTRLAETLDFISGLPAGGGPAHYAVLMDRAYGQVFTVLSLLDEPNQGTFRSLLRDFPLPQSGPSLALSLDEASSQKSWSFLGRRYQLDDLILQKIAGGQRNVQDETSSLSGGMDLMSVLGIPPATEVLNSTRSEYRTDTAQIEALRSVVQGQSAAQWSASSRNLQLEGFQHYLGFLPNDQVQELPFASSPVWAYKDLNSALGAWAELQYDTSAFFLPPEVETEAVQVSPPAPAFVEPNPGVFYQLAKIAFATAEGLKMRDMTGIFTPRPHPASLNQLLLDTLDMADRLQRLGDIAVRELSGEALNADDYALIQAPLGPAERWQRQSLLSGPTENQPRLPPISGTATFDYGGDRLMHVGVGAVDRIFMLVPLAGQVYIAQGGLYSYYEFSLPNNRPIDEAAWRRMLADAPPEPPEYTMNLYLPEGTPIDVLAYRKGDTYRVLPAAGSLRLHSSPGRDTRVVQIAAPGEMLTISEGPIEANGLFWWKVMVERDAPSPVDGWIVENQQWIERAWKR